MNHCSYFSMSFYSNSYFIRIISCSFDNNCIPYSTKRRFPGRRLHTIEKDCFFQKREQKVMSRLLNKHDKLKQLSLVLKKALVDSRGFQTRLGSDITSNKTLYFTWRKDRVTACIPSVIQCFYLTRLLFFDTFALFFSFYIFKALL